MTQSTMLTQEQIVGRLVRDRAKLLAYAWVMLRDEYTCEDVYQEVVMTAIHQSGGFETQQHLWMWARKTIRYKALAILRKQSNRPACLSNDVIDLLDGHWAQYDELEFSEMLQALRTCVQRLSPHSRNLIQLRYEQGLTGVLIAEMLGRKTKSVYMALSRTYAALAKCIQKQLGQKATAT